MLTTPKSERLTLAIVGRTNVGKSTLLNLIAGQDVAITSPIAGTTTDVVEKTMELLPFGPILLLDTAGFDDTTPLGAERLRKTHKALERADVVLAVTDGDADESLNAFISSQSKPVVRVDMRRFTGQTRDQFLACFKPMLLKVVPDSFLKTPLLFADCVPQGASVLQIIPIDEQAPKGRIILPQVQVLREALDHGIISLVTTEKEISTCLERQSVPPALAICDSQVVHIMCRDVPENIPATTYSILMARVKGDLQVFAQGAEAIDSLQDGDRILIAESCTHHAGDEDIGRVKIPNLIRKHTGKQLEFAVSSGRDFPDDLGACKLIIHCGGCMTNRAQILWRIEQAKASGVPITNYGVCISFLQGVLPRVLAPFAKQLKEGIQI